MALGKPMGETIPITTASIAPPNAICQAEHMVSFFDMFAKPRF